MNQKILIIDDDVALCEITKLGLETEGYDVELAHDGVLGLEKLGSCTFDLVILDIMMPHLNGFKTLKYIREFSDIPVIMLTARGEETDELVGLGFGADDYLHKPCSLNLLKAKIKAVLKRYKIEASKTKTIRMGNIKIDIPAMKVFKSDVQLKLTKSQFKILLYLFQNPNKVCTKEELVNKALQKTYLKEQRSIDTHINNLREILASDNDEYFSIINIYGVGYELKCK